MNIFRRHILQTKYKKETLISSLKQLIHSSIMKGTIILTLASFVTRIIGFFYKIYLADLFSTEALGLLQLITPISMLFFSFCAVGMQSAITCFIASSPEKKNIFQLFCGLIIALLSSLLSALLLYYFAGFISNKFLFDPRCENLLKIQSFSLLPATLHACISGYFLGKKRPLCPALSQIIEYGIRIFFLYSVVLFYSNTSEKPSLNLVIFANIVGEVGSSFFCLFVLLLLNPCHFKSGIHYFQNNINYKIYVERILYTNKLLLNHALPIGCNRILLNCFHSFEVTLIPRCFVLYGFSLSQSLSLFGVLSGMVVPLVYFPSAVINSICLLLLPTIANALAKNNYSQIQKYIKYSVEFCIILGVLCGIIFILSGHFIGIFLFHNELCGRLIHLFGFICPFLYLSNVLTCILNGLNMTRRSLLNHIITMSSKLAIIFFLIPKYGLKAYFFHVICSQLLLTFLNFLALHKYIIYNNSVLSEK